MGDTASSVRPTKRNAYVVANDESTNDQPVAKSVKIEVDEESVPSSQDAELQQQVLKLEDKLQRAYRAAGEYKERAETAESRLDSKYGIKEGLNAEKRHTEELKTRIEELTKKLANKDDRLFEERRNASDDRTRYRARIDELEKKLDHKSDRLEEERRRGSDDRARYRARIDDLELKLTRKDDRLAEEILFANENRARINELKQKLAEKEDLLSHELRKTNEDREKLSQYDEGPQPHSSDGHLNIFKMCARNPNECPLISYERARASILSVVNEEEGEVLDVKLKKCFARLPELKYLVLHCEACKRMFPNMTIIQHFISHGHKNMFCERGAVVSNIALWFWLDKLKQPTPQHQSTGGSAVVAARPMQHPAGSANEAFNIFKLCHAETNDSMPFVRAHADLFSVIHANEGSTTEIVNRRFAKLPQLYNLVLQCEVCNMTLSKVDIILHFNSKSHMRKVRAHNATVWVPALKNFIDVLKPDDQSMQQPGDAAVSAPQNAAASGSSSDVSEDSMEIKKEIKEEELDD